MKKTSYSDQTILEGISNNASFAIEYVYDHIKPMIMKWLYARGGQTEQAEDVFQEAMMVLFHQSKNEDFVLTSKLSTYLLAICKRLWYKQITQDKKTVLQEDFSEEEWTYSEDAIKAKEEKEEDFKRLDQALIELGSPCKELLEAFYLDNRNLEELVELFDYSNTNTAKTQRYKCMNRLRKIMNA